MPARDYSPFRLEFQPLENLEFWVVRKWRGWRSIASG